MEVIRGAATIKIDDLPYAKQRARLHAALAKSGVAICYWDHSARQPIVRTYGDDAVQRGRWEVDAASLIGIYTIADEAALVADIVAYVQATRRDNGRP